MGEIRRISDMERELHGQVDRLSAQVDEQGKQVVALRDRAIAAEAEVARLRAQAPEYWQWRRKEERWGIDQIYRHEVYATTDDSEVRQLFAAPPAQPADLIEMSPEFTDTARSALLWVLWHHQGGSSKVGQPIRFALGMGQHEHLSDYQIREAKRWGALPQTVAAQPVEPV